MKALLILFLLTVSLAAQGPAIRSGQLGTISGRLFTRDGVPAPGVRVAAIQVSNALFSEGQALFGISQTDRNGRFRLENVPAGRYLVIAGALDFPTYFPGVSVLSAASIVTLAPAAMVNGVDFSQTIVSDLRFSGKVVQQDNSGNVMAAPASTQFIQIRLQSRDRAANTMPTASVAADGSFDFPHVRPGTYQVVGTPAPRMPQVTVTLLDSDITGYELVFPLMVQVTGIVTVEEGGPAPRFPLVFSNANDRSPLPAGVASNVQQNVTVQTAPRFSTQVPAGANQLTIGDIPNGFTIKKIVAGGMDLTANPLVVTPAGAPLIQVVLSAASVNWVRVTGRVNGRTAVSPNTISLSSAQGLSAPLPVVFYLDGSFEIPKALPGSYRVGGGPTSPDFVIPAGLPEVGGLTIDVIRSDGGSSTAIPIGRPASAVRVDGRIFGRAKAEFGAEVRIENVATGEFRSAPIYADGSFEFPQMQPGDYSAEVFPTIPGAQPVSLTVGVRDIRDVQLIVPAVRDIPGRVAIEGSARPPRSVAFAAAGTRIAAEVRPDGTFAVVLPDGFRVEPILDTLPQDYAVSSLQYGPLDLLASPLRLSGPETELHMTLKMAGGAASISGRVSGDIAALADSRVWLTDNAGRRSALEAAVGPDGAFVFSNVAEDAYTVSLAVPGIAASTVAVPVMLTAGRDITGVSLPALRAVHGRVTVDGAAPPPRFGLRLTGGPAGVTTIVIEPQLDGSFNVFLPAGDRTVGTAAGLPATLRVVTAKYGATDLLTHPLQIPETGALEGLHDRARSRFTVGLSSSCVLSPISLMATRANELKMAW